MSTAILAIRDKKDGFYNITLEYNKDGEKKKLATGMKVSKRHWDKKNMRILQNGAKNVTEANKTLAAKLLEWNNLLDKLTLENSNVPPSVDMFKAALAGTTTQVKAKHTPLTQQFEAFIASQTKWQPTTTGYFNTLLGHIKDYQTETGKTWYLSTLTNADIVEFQHYLINTYEMANSTLAKHHKNLKQFLTIHPAPHVNPQTNKPLFDVLQAPPQVLYKPEIDALMALPFEPQSRLGKVRNMFIVEVFTGLRYSDLKRLEPHHFNTADKVIDIQEIKTCGIREIPLFQQVNDILTLYTDLKTGTVKLPKISNQNFNKYLAEIVASVPILQKIVEFTEMQGAKKEQIKVPKHTLIKSHCARRTFCTMLLKYYSVPEVMSFSGHKTISAFSRYVGKIEVRKDIVSDFAARFAAS